MRKHHEISESCRLLNAGQLFSTRSDLFPPEFTQELSKLQVCCVV